MERIYNVNKGLRSRFKHHIYIQNYKAKDMVKIFEQLAKEKKMELSDEFKKGLEEHLEKERLKPDFSNIRYLRDELFDKIHRNFLNRWKKDKTIKHIFEIEDLENL
jgi:Holliday junction resolvasome RuvABC ATP-dependent DNA helicase subunit